ncbi:MAG: MerR family transcriptional regulator [Synergistaceae bacterium]|nr:MerR family transcriptional regulator [Synergistaceae bacterium]
MANKGLFSISDYAKLSRTTRDTLLYYDKIGLLSPESRGENNYRYYSHGQLAVINVIRTLQELGMTLEEIKNLEDQRTPESMDELFSRQIVQIDAKIDNWVRARKLLLTLKKSINSVLKVNEDEITVQFLPAEAIVLGDLNDYSRGRNDYDALLSFYVDISEKYPDMPLNYPVWGFFSEERIKKGDWVWPDRFYFYNPEGYDKKPSALYAIGYTRGGYGQSGDLYFRMIDYINKNGFEICGDAYEEYPLNEVCIPEDKDYLMRVMITVREK